MAGTTRAKTKPAADQQGNDQASIDQATQQAADEAAATAAAQSSAQPPASEGANGEPSGDDKQPAPESEPKPAATRDDALAAVATAPATLESDPVEPDTVAADSVSPIADLLGGAIGDFIRHASHCVIEERVRQIVEEGHSPDDDLAYSKYQLERAAVGYVGHAAGLPRARLDLYWPFHPSAFKPGATRRQALVKAGALILAAIEAIDRAEAADS